MLQFCVKQEDDQIQALPKHSRMAMHVACLCTIEARRSIVLCVLRVAVGLEASSRIDSRADRSRIIVCH